MGQLWGIVKNKITLVNLMTVKKDFKKPSKNTKCHDDWFWFSRTWNATNNVWLWRAPGRLKCSLKLLVMNQIYSIIIKKCFNTCYFRCNINGRSELGRLLITSDRDPMRGLDLAAEQQMEAEVRHETSAGNHRRPQLSKPLLRTRNLQREEVSLSSRMDRTEL